MSLVELFGDKVHNKDGSEVDVASLSSNEVVGIYFSAHWCPPCRNFTPVLGEYYKKLRGQGKKFEIVFVSSDRDEAGCKEYYDSMPWLLLPYADRSRKDALAGKYGVRGIPTLVLVDSNGAEITRDGRGIVTSDENGDKFPWKKE